MILKPAEIAISPEAPFEEDAFSRKAIVEATTQLITQLPGSFVIAINSPWGTGKTTMVRMLKACLEKNGNSCVYFNAWETDFAEDPLIAFMGEMDLVLQKICREDGEKKEYLNNARKIASVVAKRAVPALLKMATVGAIDIDKEMEKFVADAVGQLAGDAIDAYQKEKLLIEQFKDNLGKVIAVVPEQGGRLPLVVFVDELDRCRPSYAIELLERIKHIFDIENVVFVVSVDKEQLGISLSAIYGVGFNVAEYLRRFFDFELKLTYSNNESFCNSLLRRTKVGELLDARSQETKARDFDGLKTTFRVMSSLLEMTPRAQEHYMGLLTIALATTPNDQYLHPVEVTIFSGLKIGLEKCYADISSGLSSVVDVINSLRERRPVLRDADDIYYLSYMFGVLLRCKRLDDERAESLVADFRGLSQGGASFSALGDNLRGVLGGMRNSGFAHPVTVDFVIRRIDIAARF